jgi:hypothetical protein
LRGKWEEAVDSCRAWAVGLAERSGLVTWKGRRRLFVDAGGRGGLDKWPGIGQITPM